MDNLISSVLDLVTQIAGLSGAELAGVLALVSVIARLIGKAIPDDAQGVLSLIRKVAKTLGLYVQNRTTSHSSIRG